MNKKANEESLQCKTIAKVLVNNNYVYEQKRLHERIKSVPKLLPRLNNIYGEGHLKPFEITYEEKLEKDAGKRSTYF